MIMLKVMIGMVVMMVVVRHIGNDRDDDYDWDDENDSCDDHSHCFVDDSEDIEKALSVSCNYVRQT